MAVLAGLAPEKVFHYFEEIAGIPHGSYNIDAISDYLVKFAEDHALRHIQDKAKNVIIYLEATQGYEAEPVLVLQGHMDMVTVTDADVDMRTVPIQLAHDGKDVYALQSSLGGDDGIAVAYMLAIADDPTIAHPALDLLFTTNEEVGMDGAIALDTSLLRGKRFLNLDSEDEGIFTVGCAGGVKVIANMSFTTVLGEAELLRIRIGGLQGGHSGQMIHLGRANALRVAGRLLYELSEQAPVQLVSLSGGTAANAIPAEAELAVLISAEQAEDVQEYIRKFEATVRHEYRGRDDGLFITCDKEAAKNVSVLSAEDTRRAAAFLLAEPDGVQEMSGVVRGLVQTSLNMGVAAWKCEEKARLKTFYEIRSMVGTAAQALKNNVLAIAAAFGAETEVAGCYPEWEYREESPLRERMIKVWKARFGTEPKVEVIHAGLECGLFASKMDGFDAVSIGPDMQDIHTTKERLSIASVERTWDFLLDVLKYRE